MLEFAWPWVLAALPLPVLARLLRPVAATSGALLRVPELGRFRVLAEAGGVARANRLRLTLGALAWVLLCLAAARPQWIGEPVEVPLTGRDLMLAVDLSESMRETDFILGGRPVDRLTATKAVARDFIGRRVGDRLGLILFGQQAYLHVPLTFDRQTVQALLDEAVIGLAGRQTAIGDALGLAVKRLREQEAEHKVLILLTDGQNTAGAIEPLRAAELAATAGLRVYTVGIGADTAVQRGFFGSVRINPSADLDEKTLKAIADQTGGRYFRARDTREFETIYAEIDQLEPVERGGEHFRPTQDLFFWPLGMAAGLFAVVLMLRGELRRRGGGMLMRNEAVAVGAGPSTGSGRTDRERVA